MNYKTRYEMIKSCMEQILSLYHFIDSLMVTDTEGCIEFFQRFRPETDKQREEPIVGKNLLEIYPTLTRENSTIFKVLETREPIFNYFQEIPTRNGDSVKAFSTTLPLTDGDSMIGAIDVSKYVDEPYTRKFLGGPLKETRRGKLYTVEDIISNSPQMEALKERIVRVANTDSSILIWGETGTGKELVAQSVHTSGNRSHRKFVSQNCAAIPATLLESILFGTTKGSFTGAEDKAGILEVANGGTVFLDEINSMDPEVQAKMLKAIDEKQIKRLGGTEPIAIDVKVVSATNQNPIECVKNKTLREDLFYRLGVVQLNIPPLRERQNDWLYLIHHFIREYNEKMNKHINGMNEDVEALLRKYSWPGNVREVKNVIEGAFNIATSEKIQSGDLPEYLVQAVQKHFEKGGGTAVDFESPSFSLKNTVEDFEKNVIEQVIEETGSYVLAAQKLKVTKQALNYKLNKYNILKE